MNILGITAHWKFIYKCKKCDKFKIISIRETRKRVNSRV